ncbi:MAG: hypothetical protein HYX68_27515 [Planctomycetes bacterium]|jgi:hypothetical protein|nr:hypothetical protein [Planctomycetota bacterium]
MNLWRWLGISMFLVGALCLVGTAKLTVYAGGKDKKVDDKTKKADDKGKKADDKTKKPDDKTKKDDDKKKVVVPPKQEPKGDLVFKAFDFDAYPKDKAYFFQEQNTKTTQKMKVMGQEVEQVQDQTFLIKWTVKPKKDGNYVVEQTIEGVKMTISIGGNKIAYDSTLGEDKQLKNPMTEFFGQLRKNSLTFAITSDLKVKSIEGRDKFIKDLGAINPQMKSLLDAILSDNALKQMAEPTWFAFPDKGVIPKDKTWQKKSELDLGPIGKYDTTFDFTYNGMDGNTKDKIGIKTKLDYTAPKTSAGLPFRILKATLTTDSGTGNAVFLRDKGRFDSSDISMKLSGSLEIEVGSMKTSVDLNQDQTAKSNTYDEKPKAWAK